jgi:FkbM family methyltransferase
MVTTRVKHIAWRFLCNRSVNSIIQLLAPIIRMALSPVSRARIPIVGETRVKMMEGVVFSLYNTGRDRFSNQFFWNGPHSYEWASIQVFSRLAKECSTIFDIGSNVGLMALVAASVNPRARIYAFEPVPGILADLEKNIQVNRFDNLRAIGAAVGDKAGSITIELPTDYLMHPITASAAIRHSGPSISRVVQCLTVDSAVDLYNLTRIDLIKSDTEGMEHRVLAGATGVLRRDRPLVLLEVWPGAAGEQIELAIREFDYRYYWITEGGLVHRDQIIGDPKSVDTNYLLIPNERLAVVKSWLSNLPLRFDN